jgi:hypothetical protein
MALRSLLTANVGRQRPRSGGTPDAREADQHQK